MLKKYVPDSWLANEEAGPDWLSSFCRHSATCRTSSLKLFPLVNIMNGFRVSGIKPTNCDIFSDFNFFTSSVTERQIEHNIASVEFPVENIEEQV